jgi:hypothetical protein
MMFWGSSNEARGKVKQDGTEGFGGFETVEFFGAFFIRYADDFRCGVRDD